MTTFIHQWAATSCLLPANRCRTCYSRHNSLKNKWKQKSTNVIFTIIGKMGPSPERRRVALEIQTTTARPSVVIHSGHASLEISGKFIAHWFLLLYIIIMLSIKLITIVILTPFCWIVMWYDGPLKTHLTLIMYVITTSLPHICELDKRTLGRHLRWKCRARAHS